MDVTGRNILHNIRKNKQNARKIYTLEDPYIESPVTPGGAKEDNF